MPTMLKRLLAPSMIAVALLGTSAVLIPIPAQAQTAAEIEATRKARAERAAQLRAERASRQAGNAAPAAAALPPPPPAADEEQLRAAERVHFGDYECEFNQRLQVQLDPKFPGYVKVVGVGVDYLMKPVASQTGAIRLEDVRQIGLLLQVAGKSMLMNVKTGQRMIDNCVHPAQR